MKVAIVGAGISGLACAYELKKNGIIPTIFEARRYIGEDVDFITTTLKLFDRVYDDPLKYIKDKYGLTLTPLSTLKRIVMNSPTKQTVVEGVRGHTFCRGDCSNSLENQILKIANAAIAFEKKTYINEIVDDYDYIVDASGTLDYARQLGLFTAYFRGFARIAVISGKFDTDIIKMWVNTEYAKSGFVFLLPHSKNKACMGLTVNDVSQNEMDYYWEKFLKQENIKYTIIKTFDVFHEAGKVYPHKANNVYFVGKSGGFLDSVLGFGMTNSIETGILAARAIAKNLDYEELVAPIYNYMEKTHEYRKLINTFDNDKLDKLVEFLGLPVIKQLIYNNPLAKITQGSIFIKEYNKFMHNN